MKLHKKSTNITLRFIYIFKIIMVSFKKNEITLKISPAIRSQIKQFVLKIISIIIY